MVTLKIAQFPSLFQRLQKSEKLLPRNLKNIKNRTSNHQNMFFAETWFLQYFQCENLVLRPPTVRCRLKHQCKKCQGNNPEKNIEFNPFLNPKNYQNGTHNQRKSIEIWFWTPTCPACCSHGPSRCPQAARIAPRVLKWRHQACQMIGVGHPK